MLYFSFCHFVNINNPAYLQFQYSIVKFFYFTFLEVQFICNTGTDFSRFPCDLSCPLSSSSTTTAIHSTNLLALSILGLQMNLVIQYILYYAWFLLFSIMFKKFVLLDVCVAVSFSVLSYISLCDYSTICLSVHLLMDIWVISAFWLV